MGQVLLGARKEVIYYKNFITLFKKLLGKMRAQKPSATGDEDLIKSIVILHLFF